LRILFFVSKEHWKNLAGVDFSAFSLVSRLGNWRGEAWGNFKCSDILVLTHLASYNFWITILNYSAIDFCVFVYISVFLSLWNCLNRSSISIFKMATSSIQAANLFNVNGLVAVITGGGSG
jgi:hypothetical protein